MNRARFAAALALVLFVTACGGPAITAPAPTRTSALPQPTTSLQPTPTGPAGGEVVLVTHDSFAASDSVIASFQSQEGGTLKVLKGGDAGAVVNQAILTKNAPLGDALYGVDNTFLSRALDAGIFVPYHSANAADLSADLNLDPQGRVTPIDYGDVCINYDKDAYVGSTQAPATIEDLAKPAYKGQLVVENPATSSPGLAFVLATIVRFGESGDYTWLDFWRDLRANDMLVVSGWEEAYYTSFSGGSGEGDRPLVVSYATSPAAEVYYADPQPADAPTGVVDDGCFRQIEFAGVLAGAKHPELAQALVDFMASPEFQADMPLNMFVFPANSKAEIPDVFAKHAAVATQPLMMDPAEIAANRERWLQEWTDAVLH